MADNVATATVKRREEDSAVGGEKEARARQVFAVELEFVQCLSNPDYLHWLAKNGYFEDSAFIEYLDYLLYWKEPEYAVYLLFPECLALLDALQDPEFRAKLTSSDAVLELKRQQSYHWLYFDRNYESVLKLFQYQI